MTKFLMSIFIIPALLMGCWSDNEQVNPSLNAEYFTSNSGVVAYNYYQPLSTKPVNIYYNIPAQGDVKTMPILFVMHGTDRNATDYLNAWRDTSNAKGVMVFAIEFNTKYYPSDTEYTQGGMYSGSTLKPEAEWAFSVIEPIFNFIVADLKSSQKKYDMWGHSAGAQFTHRYVLFKPNAKINRAVTANAGWYTLPDLTVDFPYGLKKSPATSESLSKSFAQNLTVQLGTADVIRDNNLNTSAGADAQGLNRFARGNFFWGSALQNKNSYPVFNWAKREVKDVAHEYKKMAEDAAKFMY